MVLVLDSIKVRPCLAASSVISSCKCIIKPLKYLRDPCLKTFNRTKSSLREVSNFFQPDTPMERRVMKTSIAGLADALRKKIYQCNLVQSGRQDRIFTFLDRRKPQPEQFFGQDQQLLPLPQVPSGSYHYSEREMLEFYLFASIDLHLYKKVEPANSDCFVDEMAALGTLETIGIVHQVWQVELWGKQ